jgi:predicted RNA-binding protein with EMAP domain
MKTKFLLFIALISAFATIGLAQTVKITPKTVSYIRPKPIADFKKTFTVTYPKISGISPALSKKIEKTISYAEVLQFNLKEEMGENQWLEEASYEVGYNNNGILSIYLSMTGTGAYPSVFGKNVVVDLKTGNKITSNIVFINLDELAAKIKLKQIKEVEESIEEIKNDKDYEEENPERLFESVDFTAEDLDGFSINDEGVTFTYEYGFPHVIKALEPDGNYLINWNELKPFIKRGGLLARFIR